MSTIVTRTSKGSPLTNQEMDTNLTNLNDDKLEDAPNDGFQYARKNLSWNVVAGGGGTEVASANMVGVSNVSITLDWDALRADPGSVYELIVTLGSRADSSPGPLIFRTSLNSAGVIRKWVINNTPTDDVTYTHYASGAYVDRTLTNLPNWNWTNAGTLRMIFTLDADPSFSGYGLILIDHVQQQGAVDSFEQVTGIFSHHISSNASSVVQLRLSLKDFTGSSYKLIRRQM